MERFGIPLPIPAPSAIAQIKNHVAKTNIVVLHDALYPAHLAAFLYAKSFRKPVLLIQHIGAVPYRNIVLRSLMKLANSIITKPLLARADQTVFISDAVAKQFADIKFRSPPRTIYNGVDTGVFKPRPSKQAVIAARRKFRLPDKEPVVLFVGRFVEKKGLDIMERLARMRPNMTFAFAGWGPLDPRAWGLPNVHVYAGLSGKSLAPLYKASDVFVLPSVGEGFPLVIQEALASGLPTICGAETAEADSRAARYLHAVKIRAGYPGVTATDFAREIDHALAESQGTAKSRAAFAAARYDWDAAVRAYDTIFARMTKARAQQMRQSIRPQTARRPA